MVWRKIESEFDWGAFLNHPKGWIFNDAGHEQGKNPCEVKSWGVLHAADCHTLKQMNLAFGKYQFDTIEDAYGWLRKERGGRCSEHSSWVHCGNEWGPRGKWPSCIGCYDFKKTGGWPERRR